MDDPQQDMQYCSNCKRDIASKNFMMHEVHCRRNLTLCQKCGEPVPRMEMDNHEEEFHAPVSCTLCRGNVEKAQLDEHVEKFCPRRMKKCDYCEVDVAACEHHEHLEYCGSRTEQCPLCGQYIMHKDLQQHEDTVCEYPPPKVPENPLPNLFGFQNENVSQQNNSFAWHELERVLNEPSMANDATATAFHSRNLSNGQSSERRLSNPARSQRRALNTHTSELAQSIHSRPKVTNKAATQNQFAKGNRNRSVATKKKVTNLERQAQLTAAAAENRSPQAAASHIHDESLAQQLSHEEMGEVAANVQYPDFQVTSQGSGTNDGFSIPCEFCDQLFAIDALIQHQSGCEARLFGDVNINSGAATDDHYSDLNTYLNNDTTAETVTSGKRSNLPHVNATPGLERTYNNLQAHDDNAGPASISYMPDNNIEESFLPCEFCDILIPLDGLIQHQIMCEAAMSDTPQPSAQSNILKDMSAMLNAASADEEPLAAASAIGVSGNSVTNTSSRRGAQAAASGRNISTVAPATKDQVTQRRQKSVKKVENTLQRMRENPTYNDLPVGSSPVNQHTTIGSHRRTRPPDGDGSTYSIDYISRLNNPMPRHTMDAGPTTTNNPRLNGRLIGRRNPRKPQRKPQGDI